MLICTANTARAPLGNKTTNAKTVKGQIIGGKGAFNNFEKSQLKPLNTQVVKPKTGPAAPAFAVQADTKPKNITAEPEYAPSERPRPLPYKSDVLPENGLTFEGLKRKNVLAGYYNHFYNNVDASGSSKAERGLKMEKKRALEQIEALNVLEIDALQWNLSDSPQKGSARATQPSTQPKNHPAATANRIASSIVSKRPASVLTTRPKTTVAPARPAPSASLALKASVRPKSIQPFQAKSAINLGPSTGEIASRNSVGYRHGRAVSGALRERAPSASVSRAHDNTNASKTKATEPIYRSDTSREPDFAQIFNDDEGNISLTTATLGAGSLLDDDEDAEDDFQLSFD